MTLNDPLASALSKINNASKIGKSNVVVKTSSNLIKDVLKIFNENGYVGDVEEIIDSKGNSLSVSLIGKLNKCAVIKPRFAVKSLDFEKYEKRFLLAKGFGFLIVSTNQGIMTHDEAKTKKLGGKLICFCY